ncbi:MAG: hypothetical protein RBS99_11905, partial [Rhodospirillales bacterium]|nr:hypothetical protein [Rhodospirillales bacterium]
QTLTDVTETGADGLTLTEPAATPLAFAPLEAKTYSVSIATTGPPTIDALFVFDFIGFAVELAVTGQRVVVWPFVPQVGMTETLEWKTDIIQAKASEQRISLRTTPRQSLQGEYWLEEWDYSRAKAMMRGWAHRLYAVPMWSDAQYLGAVSPGTLTLTLDTGRGDFAAGGVVVLFQENNQFEALEVDSLTASSLTLKLATVGTYSAAWCLPALFSHAEEGLSARRNADGVVFGTVSFLGTDTRDLADTTLPQLRGKDLLLSPSVVLGDLSEQIWRDVEVLDDEIGVRVLDPRRDFPEFRQTLNFDLLTSAELWPVRRWLHAVRGKQKTFFVPTWNQDIVPLADIALTDVSITARVIDYNLYLDAHDIVVRLLDGTTYLNRTTGAAIDLDGNETIYLAAAFGVDIPLATIDRISFISHVRLDSDRVELRYREAGAVSVSIPITEVPE